MIVAIVIVGVLLAILTLGAADARRTASLSDSINNLKQISWAGSTYTADCGDRFWTFSWTRDNHPEGFFPGSDQDAAALQAWDIMRRRGGATGMSPISNWFPHIGYSTLVLADHMNFDLPLPWVASPMDTQRLSWQACADQPSWAFMVACFMAIPGSQRPTDGSINDLTRYMFSSSYQLAPAFVSRNQREGTRSTATSTITTHYSYDAGTLPLGDRLMTQVAYPSRKAMVWDTYQRHFARRFYYYAYPEARVPMLLADGSALVRATAESNGGFYPNNPTEALPLRFSYAPRSFEYATRSGGPQEVVTGHYQWTRGGLSGRDFGDREVCTGQPGCTP